MSDNSTTLINKLLTIEMDATQAADKRRIMRDERIALMAKVQRGTIMREDLSAARELIDMWERF